MTRHDLWQRRAFSDVPSGEIRDGLYRLAGEFRNRNASTLGLVAKPSVEVIGQLDGCCRRRSKTARFCRSKSARCGWGLSLGVGFGSDAGEGVEASVAEPVAGAFEGEDFGVVDDAVDHGGGDGLVSEHAAPA